MPERGDARRMHRRAPWSALLVLTLALAGCMDASDESMGSPDDDSMGDPMDSPMDGAGTMGEGDAMVTELAMARLETLPEGALAWVAYRLAQAEEGSANHSHGPAFAYAAEHEVYVVANGTTDRLAVGQALHIPAGVEHTHPDGGWEVRLESPDEEPPAEGTPLFRSEALEGVPDAPVDARFVHVRLPPGSMTAVHEHPGPEYVWMSEGTIEYQSDLTGTIRLTQDEDHALPPRTAVQKRNPADADADAAFLSFFLVDPDQPFVIDSRFE